MGVGQRIWVELSKERLALQLVYPASILALLVWIPPAKWHVPACIAAALGGSLVGILAGVGEAALSVGPLGKGRAIPFASIGWVAMLLISMPMMDAGRDVWSLLLIAYGVARLGGIWLHRRAF